MLPVPLQIPVCREIRCLAGMDLSQRSLANLCQFLMTITGVSRNRDSSIRFHVGGQTIDIGVTFQPTGFPRVRELAVLRLPERPMASEVAGRILGDYFKKRDFKEESPADQA
jgi:hypothetical protein